MYAVGLFYFPQENHREHVVLSILQPRQQLNTSTTLLLNATRYYGQGWLLFLGVFLTIYPTIEIYYFHFLVHLTLSYIKLCCQRSVAIRVVGIEFSTPSLPLCVGVEHVHIAMSKDMSRSKITRNWGGIIFISWRKNS